MIYYTISKIKNINNTIYVSLHFLLILSPCVLNILIASVEIFSIHFSHSQNSLHFSTNNIPINLIVLAVEPMVRLTDPVPSTLKSSSQSLQNTSTWNQLKVLMRRGYIKTKRDQVCVSKLFFCLWRTSS